MFLLGTVLGCGGLESKPAWQKAQVLADSVDHPQAITTDENFVYYVTGGTIASLNEGTSGVWKMPLAGGEATQLFKGHQIDKDHVNLPEGFFLVTDDKYVYWSSGSIWRTPKNGGESQKISSGMPTTYAIDDANIYWQNFGGENSPPKPIYVVDKNGGEPKEFTEPVITSGIVVDKDFVYWAQSDGIFKKAKTGGEKTKVYSPADKENISGLISDQDNFYFTKGNGRNALYKLSRNGGEPVQLAKEINHVHKFFVDETNVYYVADESSFSTAIVKIPKGGGEVVRVDGGYLSSFTVGKSSLFITDIGKIYSMAK